MAAEQRENKKTGKFYAKVKGITDRLDSMKGAKAWLWGALIYALSLAFVMLPFVFRGTYTVWTNVAGDGVKQFITFFEHMKEVGWLKGVGDYDFYIGLGGDYLTTFSFYSLFDPFNLILFGLPFGAMVNYTLTMACKQLACAMTMFAYLRHRKVQNSRAIMLSAAYMLSGFVAYTFVRHYNLAVGPIYLPLAIMGVEKLFRKERPYLFIAALFFCLISNFYVFFSLSVFVVAYAVGYYFQDCANRGEKKSVKGFFAKLVPIGGYYLLTVALAGMILLPNFYGYLHAARSGSKGVDAFNLTTFLSQALTLFLPIAGKNYSVIWLNFANAALLLYALCKRNKRTRLQAILIVVLAIGYLFPLFGYAMNIFNYSNNRWSYGLSFFIYVLIGLQSAEDRNAESAYDDGSIKKINGFFVAYAAVLSACALPVSLTALKVSRLLVVAACLPIAALIGVGAYFLLRFLQRKGVAKIFKKIYQPTVLFALGFALTLGYCLGYYVVYSTQHDGKRRYAELFSQEEQYIAERSKSEFFRGDVTMTGVWYDNYGTRGMNNGYYGTTLYSSISDGGVYEFLCENGVYNPTQTLGISGLDGRCALQALLSVKYTCNAFYQPYGFTKVDGYEYLYENENYLPFGFVTNRVYSREQYLALPVLERQNLLLKGVVLDKADDGLCAPTEEGNLKKYAFDGAGEVTERETSYTLPMTGETDYRNHEVYVVIKGVKDVLTNGTSLSVICNGVGKECYYAIKGNLMYSDERDTYLHFGVLGQDVEALHLELSLNKGKLLQFDSLEIQAIPIEDRAEGLDGLSAAAHLANVQLADKGLKGELTSATDGYLVLTLPYSEGWTAYVDGEKAEILQADTAFMAMKIEGSDDAQTVELRYQTPYLKEGKTVGYLGLGALGCVIVCDTAARCLKKSKEKKEEGDNNYV